MNLYPELKKLKGRGDKPEERRLFVEKWAYYLLKNPKDGFKQHTHFMNKEMKKIQQKYENVSRVEYCIMKGEPISPSLLQGFNFDKLKGISHGIFFRKS